MKVLPMKYRCQRQMKVVFSILLVLIVAGIAACSVPAATTSTTAQTTTQDTAPVLSVDPPSITESFTEGDTNTVDETINVHNYGKGVMIWAATATYPWLWMEDTSGALEAGLMSTVKIHISPSALKADTYTADINVEGSGAEQSPQIVKVTMVIKPVPVAATDVNGGPLKKEVPPPPWDYVQYKDGNYKFILKYPETYQAKQLSVLGSTFGAVNGNNTNSSDSIMTIVTGSYGMSANDVVMEVAKNAIRVQGGRPNPKITTVDNTTTLADGATPAYEYVIDSKSSGSPSYEFYAFGYKTGSRYIFFGAVASSDIAAKRMETWKQIGQTLETGD